MTAPHSSGAAPVASPDELAAHLTSAQRRALRQRQEDLLADRAIVSGHGMTMRALRSRGIITGAMPHATLTELGREVVAAAPQIDGAA